MSLKEKDHRKFIASKQDECIKCLTFLTLFQEEIVNTFKRCGLNELSQKACQALQNDMLKLSQNIKTLESLEVRVEKTVLDRLNTFLEAFRMRMIDLEFKIPSEELKKFGVDEKAYYEKRLRPDCFYLAFYKLLEPRVMPYILGRTTRHPFECKKGEEYGVTIKRLVKWGYKQVNDPQAGDLILYINKNEAAHVGCLSLQSGLSQNGEPFPFIPIPLKMYKIVTEHPMYF